jgi:hypothetical protein
MNLTHAGVVQKDVTPRQGINVIAANPSPVRLRTGNGLIYFSSFLLLGSAAAKLLPVQPVAIGMAALGFFGSKLIFIAFLEIASALLFAYPPTRSFGLLMLSAYLGGAIAVHVGHDQLPLQPAIVLAAVWLSVWLRYPESLRSN